MTLDAARRTVLKVTYNNQDVTEELQKCMLDWSYTDNLSGEIDSLSIHLEDRNVLWLGNWFPAKGSTIEPEILRGFWGKHPYVTKLGLFEIDEIQGKNSVITINALATSENSSLRGEEKCNAWENTYLKNVISEIASKNGMTLVWESSENPKKDRYEQDNQTDLAFIYQLCKDEGLCLKISNNKIVVLDEKDYEEQPPVETIRRVSKLGDIIQVKSWSFKTSLTDTYKACRVTHHDTSKKKNITATFVPPSAPKVGRTLVVKQQVSSQEEALKLAKKKLREKNKEATTIALDIFAYMHIDAGMTFNLVDFGNLNGKYIAYKVEHNAKGSTLHLRKCLEGY